MCGCGSGSVHGSSVAIAVVAERTSQLAEINERMPRTACRLHETPARTHESIARLVLLLGALEARTGDAIVALAEAGAFSVEELEERIAPGKTIPGA